VIAVDTNVVIRLLTGDDPAQYERAHRLFATETIFLPKTVLLESEWVLRSLYSLAPERIVHAITALVALPQVRCEDAAVVSKALEWLHAGLDFADALHLASSHMAISFATFDRAWVRRAKVAASGIAVVAP
jgi:predicted nucleic-acid-binding protein